MLHPAALHRVVRPAAEPLFARLPKSMLPYETWGFLPQVRGYQGNGVTLRRASDNATLTLPACRSYRGFRAQALAFSAADDLYGVTMPGQMGRDNLGQATAAKQPKLDLFGFNGLPAFVFDGVDDVIAALASAVASRLSGTDVPFTLAIAAACGKLGGSTNAYNMAGISTTTGNNQFHLIQYYHGNKYGITRRDNAGGTAASNLAAADLTGLCDLIVMRFNGATVDFWVNGVRTLTAAALDENLCTFDQICVGALRSQDASGFSTQYFHGMTVWDRALTDAEVARYYRVAMPLFGFNRRLASVPAAGATRLCAVRWNLGGHPLLAYSDKVLPAGDRQTNHITRLPEGAVRTELFASDGTAGVRTQIQMILRQGTPFTSGLYNLVPGKRYLWRWKQRINYFDPTKPNCLIAQWHANGDPGDDQIEPCFALYLKGSLGPGAAGGQPNTFTDGDCYQVYFRAQSSAIQADSNQAAGNTNPETPFDRNSSRTFNGTTQFGTFVPLRRYTDDYGIWTEWAVEFRYGWDAVAHQPYTKIWVNEVQYIDDTGVWGYNDSKGVYGDVGGYQASTARGDVSIDYEWMTLDGLPD